MRLVHCKKENYDVYIGRPGKWGNPYTLDNYTREEAIELYRKYLWSQIKSGKITIDDLKQLQGKTLGCWCSPLPCHGEVIISAVKWATKNQPPEPVQLPN